MSTTKFHKSQKSLNALKLLFTRLALALMLSCSMLPSIPHQIPGIPQASVTAEASTKYSKATIKKVQKKLNKLGYDCGTPDGIKGEQTGNAIKEYQKDHDLKATGTVNASLLKSLNIKPVKVQSSGNTSSSAGSEDTNTLTVYITDTGSKYHRDGCRYLRQSQHAISLSNAQSAGYDACSVCRP